MVTSKAAPGDKVRPLDPARRRRRARFDFAGPIIGAMTPLVDGDRVVLCAEWPRTLLEMLGAGVLTGQAEALAKVYRGACQVGHPQHRCCCVEDPGHAGRHRCPGVATGHEEAHEWAA